MARAERRHFVSRLILFGQPMWSPPAKAISRLLYFEANAARNAYAAQQQSLDTIDRVAECLFGSTWPCINTKIVPRSRCAIDRDWVDPLVLLVEAESTIRPAPDLSRAAWVFRHHWRMPALNRLIYRRCDCFSGNLHSVGARELHEISVSCPVTGRYLSQRQRRAMGESW